MNLYLKTYLTVFCPLFLFGQSSQNKTLIDLLGFTKYDNYANRNHPLSINYNQKFYLNSNLPNFENENGYYFPKGYGSYTSINMSYRNTFFEISFEPIMYIGRIYNININEKTKLFSVLNDVPLDDVEKFQKFTDTGMKLVYNKIKIGYGNWNRWWGPGLHNSLVLTNNSKGFYHYFLGSEDNFINISKNMFIKFNYILSESMINQLNAKFFLTAYYLNLKYKNLEFGYSKNILSGGFPDLSWTKHDALFIPITKKNIHLWDSIDDFFVMLSFPDEQVELFIEIGRPNTTFLGNNPEEFSDHGVGSNIGLRKIGVFGSNKLLFGVEYTRLVQSMYYNILPSSNWYDNIKYSYSSYKGRRWAAHSGSDSDDFLVFLGYLDERKSLIFGLNYERHGVSFHFPPEVKFEYKLQASIKYGRTDIQIKYENEYFEHYGFVDSNNNVWLDTFEEGSINRTNSLLINIKRSLY
tara:strand:+ start:1433 stop:2830 length:1398 start_codon:yes stop_codon:yes gene_type:complete